MSQSPPSPKRRRWLGTLLSLFVPGFGVLRAGLPRRAIAWFVGIQLFAVIAALSISLSVVLFWLAVLLCAVAITAQIWMLCDSFRPGRMTPRLWILFVALLTIILLLPAPTSLVARAFKIPTGAMEPTLLGSQSTPTPDHVIVNRLSYLSHPPQRGDLIVFATSEIQDIRQPPDGIQDEVFYIKRLVGLPGETIRIADGKLYADGKALGLADGIPDVHYTDPIGTYSTSGDGLREYVIGPDEYFVLGDNSPNSLDSRYWGCVPASAVYGKATTIYYPFSRAGRIARPSGITE